jgi:peptidoglycan/LPS O-acetylase OafA/YrhL
MLQDKPLPSVPRPEPITSLTGLRFFAAAAVVFFHFGRIHFRRGPDFVQNILRGGGSAVTLFFILSGFVLAYNYAPSARAGSFNKWTFWRNRFARIYPVYLLALLLTLDRMITYVHQVLHPASPHNILQALAPVTMVLTLTQAWDYNYYYAWNYPAWTLSVEMFFYLTFPWICAAVYKTRPARLLPAAGVLAFCGFAIGTIYLAVASGILGVSVNDPRGYFWIWMISTLPIMRLPEFVLGMVLARMFLARPELRIEHRDTLSILAFMGILTVLAFRPGQGILTPVLLTPLFALLIYALASGPGILSGFLSLPFLVLLGEASYALYILQVPIMDAVFRMVGNNGRTFLLAIVTLTAFSIASYLYFETPVRRWIRNRWAGRKEPSPAAAMHA